MLFALDRAGIEGILTDDPEEIISSDKVIFPGQGEAKTTMAYLRDRKLDHLIKNLKQPVLGICVGLQLLCKHSEESNTDCIGIFDHNVLKFDSSKEKVPQIGWNLTSLNGDPLFKGLNKEEYFYFVHSYYAELGKDSLCETDYSVPFCSGLHKDNFWAVQFHPEKSSKAGQQIIQNFLDF